MVVCVIVSPAIHGRRSDWWSERVRMVAWVAMSPAINGQAQVRSPCGLFKGMGCSKDPRYISVEPGTIVQERVVMSLHRLHLHFVWTTCQREPLISPDAESVLYPAIAAKARALGAIVHRIGGIADHVHLLVPLPSTMAPSTFIGQVKGGRSHLMGKVLGTAFGWQMSLAIHGQAGRFRDLVSQPPLPGATRVEY